MTSKDVETVQQQVDSRARRYVMTVSGMATAGAVLGPTGAVVASAVAAALCAFDHFSSGSGGVAA